MPTAICSALTGISVRAGPSRATRAPSTAAAAPAPARAQRQPRTPPTARITVSASTNSTIEARKAAVIAEPTWLQPMA